MGSRHNFFLLFSPCPMNPAGLGHSREPSIQPQTAVRSVVVGEVEGDTLGSEVVGDPRLLWAIWWAGGRYEGGPSEGIRPAPSTAGKAIRCPSAPPADRSGL